MKFTKKRNNVIIKTGQCICTDKAVCRHICHLTFLRPKLRNDKLLSCSSTFFNKTFCRNSKLKFPARITNSNSSFEKEREYKTLLICILRAKRLDTEGKKPAIFLIIFFDHNLFFLQVFHGFLLFL